MNRFELRDNSRVVLIVLGSVVGALFLMVLVCGGMAFVFVTKASQAIGPQLQAQADLIAADMAVQGFLNQLATGQTDVAYDSTTPAFRAKQTLPQFKTFVEGNPLLTKFITAQQAPMMNNPPGLQQMTLHYTLNGDGRAPLNVTIQVVKEGEQWTIDSVSVP
jgi:hypothetical protein